MDIWWVEPFLRTEFRTYTFSASYPTCGLLFADSIGVPTICRWCKEGDELGHLCQDKGFQDSKVGCCISTLPDVFQPLLKGTALCAKVTIWICYQRGRIRHKFSKHEGPFQSSTMYILDPKRIVAHFILFGQSCHTKGKPSSKTMGSIQLGRFHPRALSHPSSYTKCDIWSLS